MIRKAIMLAVAVSLECSAFQAQPDRLCSIRGSVANELTGEPLPKAYLRLIPTLGKKQFSLSVSGREGSFSFEGIEPGTYQIEARHQGFLNREFDEHNGSAIEFKLNPGDKLADVAIKLTPQSVVSGRVVDEDGDPWAHARAYVAKSVFKDGKRTLQYAAGGPEYMDDQGQFRIAELPPGRYFLFAEPDQSWERNFRPGDSHLLTTWYPSSADAGGATPVVLAAGQSLSDLEIRLRRGVKEDHFVRGRVSSMEAIPPAQPGNPYSRPTVRARINSSLTAQEGGGDLRPDGSFEIRVPTPGSYDVVVRSGMIPSLGVGTATVEVTDRDINDLVIEVKPPRPLKGVIRIEGDGQLPLSGWTIGLDSLGHSYSIPLAPSQADGKFEFVPIAQESYRVSVGGPPDRQFYLKRIRIGDVESRDGTFSFAGTEAPLELILSPHPASLVVSITPSKSSPSKVVLIPDTSDAAARAYGTAVAVRDQNGLFTLRGLAPGAYKLFAFESVPDDAWKDAQFVEAVLDKGVKVQVEEGASKGVEVPVFLKSDIAEVLTKLGME